MYTQILVSSLVAGICLIGGYILYINGKAFYIKWKRRLIKKRDKQVRDYLRNFKDGDKLEIVDETPREVFVGDRFYLLKPLKYRQYTRLCILFAKMLQKLNEAGVEVVSGTSMIGSSMEVLEDDYFRAIALILYFSNHEKDEDEKKVFEGMQKEYSYLKAHASLEQIVRVLEIIQIQNDIDRALKAFGLLGKKKAVLSKK